MVGDELPDEVDAAFLFGYVDDGARCMVRIRVMGAWF